MAPATRKLARQGRGNDIEVAHVARGEFVIPRALQTPEVMAALSRAAAAGNVPLETLSVGNPMNSINPNTGAAEFGLLDGFGDWMVRSLGPKQAGGVLDSANALTPEMNAHVARTLVTPINMESPKLEFADIHRPTSQAVLDNLTQRELTSSRSKERQFISNGAHAPVNEVGLWESFKYGLKDPGSELVHMVRGVFAVPQEEADRRMAQRELQYEMGRDLAGRSGFDIPRLLGQVVATQGIGPAIKGASIAGDFAPGAINGGVKGSLKPTSTDSDWERAKNIGAGAIVGGALGASQGLFGRGRQGLGRAIHPPYY
jgi:hypothetical protein